jgi:hypothetical protein
MEVAANMLDIQSNVLGDWLKGEAENLYSREEVTVLAGAGSARVLKTGTVLGRLAIGAATAAAATGNAGNGTIGTVTVSTGAKPGVYHLVAIEPAANAGTFEVEDPDGVLVGTATVGVAFSLGGLAFTIADGAADFAAGDRFTITVAKGSGQVKQIDFTAADGSNAACGVLLLGTTAPDGVDTPATAIVRQAIVSDAGLIWPAGATDSQKAAALAQLKNLGIIARQGA